MYLFQKIEDAAFKESDARRTIGEFVLANRDNMDHYSMEEVAKRTYTSKATLVRFAKYFGYSGWIEFIYALSHELVYFNDDHLDVDVNLPFDKTSDTLEIIENIATLQIQTIKETTTLMSVSDVNKAVQLLDNADMIAIYGRSPNSYLGNAFKRKLNTINKKAFLASESESGLISNSLTSNDCAIIISYSGSGAAMYPMKHIPRLLLNNVPIICLTSGGENYLSEHSNIKFTICSREKLYSKISNFSTEESIQLILNILFSKLFSLNYDKNMETKIEGARVLESSRKTMFKDIAEDFELID